MVSLSSSSPLVAVSSWPSNHDYGGRSGFMAIVPWLCLVRGLQLLHNDDVVLRFRMFVLTDFGSEHITLVFSFVVT
jgi:hypothetical protein